MANLYEMVKQGITAYSCTNDDLHEICVEINKAYDNFDFDSYENLLDVFSDHIEERNWLEDLCTDLRTLGSWDKC